ncbi:MAG TPA: NF038130 family PEP-CTERM protein [Accumulibacter sp.]|uniref:NF038130 family PEP-CTERM protein n=1 Tax=Accumulibacter sp. TaxID=2053492 RepID=UPI0025F6B81A|nr:NF038130 family PEP-CTERM protein [Accumulibacter sp.]MCM8600596.1 NF038130 family PEP-CTERM protein [Accumulibacter sp.]MCM8664747.1 NF038130 family PEP-CTERM protein [Accumulibacter sp.]HNC52216.1 NF038130 family PEP-CTERM protein [Accumulibacter sp.]
MTEVKEFSMSVSRSNTSIAVLSLAMAAGSVHAATWHADGGTCQTWLPSAPGSHLLVSNSCSDANVAAALSGDGNVELGKLASTPVTTLSGNVGGHSVVLSSLVASDWTVDLRTQYVTRAFASAGMTLTASQLAAAVQAMANPTLYARLSDPNVSSISDQGGNIVVTLDGFYNTSPVLLGLVNAVNAIIPGTANDINPADVPAFSQASEVVKMQVDGGAWTYRYGFSAFPTGYSSADGSYSGGYPTPEPGTVALFGASLFGLFFGRRRLS